MTYLVVDELGLFMDFQGFLFDLLKWEIEILLRKFHSVSNETLIMREENVKRKKRRERKQMELLQDSLKTNNRKINN